MGYQVLALNDNEEIMIDLRKHVLALAQSFIAFLAFSGLVIFLYSVTKWWWFLLFWFWIALIFFGRYINYRQERFLITTQRVVFRHGTLKMSIYEIPLSKITAVISRQGILGRLAGFGTLSIEHSDDRMSVYEMLPQPELIKRELSQLIQ
ncbi:MAG: hypothetical protein CM15mP49_28120 [Actinomycetota bacterium]|jgi:uncharacterized membrane protein YdbT with pleckstrin-like domain|nr:hypothetical protein [Acidimicrobiaceae bacterium]MBD17270.1 hypothetical protein [Actinomycetota bacterium]MDP6340473.1 PH domain-containing protein [Acidimicrobiales bacterium]MBJ45500.1 hypothetical protein [Acidimicrobiaceae bacterium]MEC8767331.1 PH domain-containing protein [Actinomycetota bacterium]|tara:strand:+ start:903 stop:1352 length:450 start_codon:yes stop_codon:yes gene_type:complete